MCQSRLVVVMLMLFLFSIRLDVTIDSQPILRQVITSILTPFYTKLSHFSTSTSIICRRIDPYYHLTYLFWTNNDKLLHFSLKLYTDIQTKGHLSFPLFKCRWLPFNWMKRDFYLVTLSMFKHMISLVHFFGEISSLLKY